MARMSIEQKFADKTHEHLIRMDFQHAKYAYYFSLCGYNLQLAMFKIVRHLIALWATDYDDQEDRGSSEYYNMTVYAKRLQDVIDTFSD